MAAMARGQATFAGEQLNEGGGQKGNDLQAKLDKQAKQIADLQAKLEKAELATNGEDTAAPASAKPEGELAHAKLALAVAKL